MHGDPVEPAPWASHCGKQERREKWGSHDARAMHKRRQRDLQKTCAGGPPRTSSPEIPVLWTQHPKPGRAQVRPCQAKSQTPRPQALSSLGKHPFLIPPPQALSSLGKYPFLIPEPPSQFFLLLLFVFGSHPNSLALFKMSITSNKNNRSLAQSAGRDGGSQTFEIKFKLSHSICDLL